MKNFFKKNFACGKKPRRASARGIKPLAASDECSVFDTATTLALLCSTEHSSLTTTHQDPVFLLQKCVAKLPPATALFILKSPAYPKSARRLEICRP
jgi:hypothetical protein